MPRWLNGAPKKIYVLVDNHTANTLAFDTKRARTDWLKTNHPQYPLDRYTFTTYVQEVK